MKHKVNTKERVKVKVKMEVKVLVSTARVFPTV